MNAKNELSELDQKVLNSLKVISEKCNSITHCSDCSLSRREIPGRYECKLQDLAKELDHAPCMWNLVAIKSILMEDPNA